jgi:Fe-S-cluster containining protein
MGSGFLSWGDSKKLAQFLGISEKELKEKHLEEVELFNKKLLRPKLERKGGKPYGKCTFYDAKKGCMVHSAKPLQCVVSMGCGEHGEELQTWFMLNHMVNAYDPEAIRQYADYLAAGGKMIPGGKLEELVPDKKVLKKILSFEMLK